jgi:hypothetical protein
LVGAPEGGYATAGVGEMPPDWPQFVMRRLCRPWTEAVELTLEPGTSAAAPLQSLRQRPMQAWMIDISRGLAHWLDHQIDRRVRRQVRISEDQGVATSSYGSDGLDCFLDLYGRALERKRSTDSALEPRADA